MKYPLREDDEVRDCPEAAATPEALKAAGLACAVWSEEDHQYLLHEACDGTGQLGNPDAELVIETWKSRKSPERWCWAETSAQKYTPFGTWNTARKALAAGRLDLCECDSGTAYGSGSSQFIAPECPPCARERAVLEGA